MRILLLGGTRFLGRHIAEAALAAGHVLTLVHRGRSGPTLFPQARHLIADRDADLSALGGSETWDVAIDTSAYVPRQVRTLAQRLAGRVGRFQFVSTISVYASPLAEGAAESAPLATMPPGADVDQLTGETYGPLKAMCEAAAIEGFGAACTLIARPGLIVGPYDPTGRFSWWVQRLLRGGQVLAPGPLDGPVQFIDARDIADWMLRQAISGTTGTFNLTGPARPLSMQGFLETAASVLNDRAQLQWADGAWLLDQGVRPWMELPMWLPPGQAQMMTVNVAAALGTGLTLRPMSITLLDTAHWLASAPPPPAPGPIARQPAGMTPPREAELLQRLSDLRNTVGRAPER